MSIDRAITGGQVATPSGIIPADVLISGEQVAGVVSPGTAPSDVGETIDARGLLVMPGMVDIHVHTREPGYEHKEDLITCSQAAAAGGVTTMFGMPNLNPPTTTTQALYDVFQMYANKSIIDYNHNPAATQPAEFQGMVDAGIACFKIFMVVDTARAYPHPQGTGTHNHGHLLEIMRAIQPTGLPLMVHPHDQQIMDLIEQEYWARNDRSPRAYAETLAAFDGIIWDTAIALLIRLSEATGCPVIILHTNTRRSIDMIRQAKARGVPINCEVNHWTLFLARWDMLEDLGPYMLSYCTSDDNHDAVWEGARDGTINMMASDHAPHTREEKEVGWKDMWAAHSGTPGIQYEVPLLLDAALDGKMSLERAVEMMTTAPADLVKLKNKGRIVPGADADITLVDLNANWTIDNDDVLSRCGWTPYHGRQVKPKVLRTLLRGQDIYRDGQVVGEPGYGKQTKPQFD